MAQLLLAGFKLVCNLPLAKVIGPPILAMNPINPLNIAVYLAWLLSLKLSKSKWTKSLAPTWRKAALWATLFYFITLIPLYLILLFITCKVAHRY